jgi:hypothetical protein
MKSRHHLGWRTKEQWREHFRDNEHLKADPKKFERHLNYCVRVDRTVEKESWIKCAVCGQFIARIGDYHNADMYDLGDVEWICRACDDIPPGWTGTLEADE